MLTSMPLRGLTVALLVTLAALGGLAGCGGESATQSETDAEQFLLVTDLFAIDYATNTTVLEITEDTITLESVGTDSLEIGVGTILIGQAAGAVLREVTGLELTETPGELEEDPSTWTYEMTTTEASLNDAILNGQILWQQLLTLQNAYSSDRTTFDDSALPGLAITSSGVEFTDVVLADTTLAESGARLEVSLPSARFQFSPRLDLYCGYVIDVGLTETYSLIKGDLEWESSLRVVTSDSLSFTHEVTLFDALSYSAFGIDNDGNLPLQADVTVGLTAELTVQAGGPVDAEINLAEVSALEMGTRHLRGREWYDLWDAETEVASYSLSYDVDHDLVVQLTLRPTFTTSIHGGAGSQLSPELITRFDGLVSADPWQWQLNRQLAGDWSFDPSRLEAGIEGSSGRIESDPELLAEDGAGSTEDITPPARVADLVMTAVDSTSVELAWTAPGDDGLEGLVESYDVRYSTWDQVLLQWEQSQQAGGEPTPTEGGTRQSMTIEGLLPGTTYHFAIESVDDAGNASAISNVALARTLGQNLEVPPYVFVPAGTFRMGDGTAPCGEDEHEVTLTRDLYVGQYEITNGQYLTMVQWAHDAGLIFVDGTRVKDAAGDGRLLMDMTTDDCEITFDHDTELFSLRQSSFALTNAYPGGYDPTDHPVKRVTWYGAVSYCNWLSLSRGLAPAYDPSTWQVVSGRTIYETEGYRLPTDAEWEHVAQYGHDGIYPWGREAPTCELSNVMVSNVWCLQWTAPVGSYPDGAQVRLEEVVYDLTGNLWEWCHDLWKCDLGAGAVTDPAGAASGDRRVLRGGSWSSENEMYRLAARSDFTAPSYPSFLAGFRIARTVTP